MQVLAKPGIGQDVRKMKAISTHVDQLSISIPITQSRPPSEPTSPARRLPGDRPGFPPVPKPARVVDPYNLYGKFCLSSKES